MSIKVPSVVVHPFDLNRSQVELTLLRTCSHLFSVPILHKKEFRRNANKLASASINVSKDVTV